MPRPGGSSESGRVIAASTVGYTKCREELWLISRSARSGDTFAMMKRIKEMFDPMNLLNRSRLYGRI
jgi:FAD/FMN-containing dehydrogenase